ncbi:MAG: glycerol-3-phosphate dehydrogenase [Hyphomicrobiaceae bacterium]|nr:glycerol-3-phosphate dehydrogenase [Hyphomicrobiaceae bacterium]
MYDIAIIGGGVNGCGIARDAAGRGLRVLLVEMDDLASGTSSRSTKLIHGGLRYLEHFEFSLVRHSLIEREVLYKMAPHIIAPLRFVLPHQKGMRPLWLMRLGLFLYDHLGGRTLLAASRALDLRHDEAGAVLQAQFGKGFEYSDCRVDDARLVILNALDAHEQGADIRTHTKLVTAQRDGKGWDLQLRDLRTGKCVQERAGIVINAAGPWVEEVILNRLGVDTPSQVRKVKGSHIVVPRLFEHERAYIFQNLDKRIIFAIPYEGDFTLIGPADVESTGEPGDVVASAVEIGYLCAAVSDYFKKPVRPADVVWSFAGVRPLFGHERIDPSKLTRDYVLELDEGEGKGGGENEGTAPMLSIFGGKITTYRVLAQKVLQKLEDVLPEGARENWTSEVALPGGDFAIGGFEEQVERLQQSCVWMDEKIATRLVRAYGTRALQIFTQGGKALERGENFGAGLYELEVSYLLETEWARSADDILWRRSKLGLRFSKEQVARLENWLLEEEKGA